MALLVVVLGKRKVTGSLRYHSVETSRDEPSRRSFTFKRSLRRVRATGCETEASQPHRLKRKASSCVISVRQRGSPIPDARPADARSSRNDRYIRLRAAEGLDLEQG